MPNFLHWYFTRLAVFDENLDPNSNKVGVKHEKIQGTEDVYDGRDSMTSNKFVKGVKVILFPFIITSTIKCFWFVS